MDGDRLDVGEILQRASHVAKDTAAGLLVYVVGLSGAAITADLTGSESGGSNLVVNILSIAAGYFLLRAVVRNAGLSDGLEGNGFGAYFGLSILYGLSLLVGFVFLVIPGLILVARWQPAFAILMAERDATVTGAMSKAWDMTGDHFWPLLAATLIGVAMMAVSLGIYISYDLGYAASFEVANIVGNILLTCSSAYFTVIGVAAYSLLRGPRSELDEVFA